MINNSRFNFFLKVSLALLSFLFLLLSCTGTTNTDSTSNSSKVAITGIFTYTPLDIEQGTVTNTSPTWTGALANQTVIYTIAKQNGTKPASITINSSTGVISLTTSALIADSGTYTITASGTENYTGTKQTTITITIRPVGATLTAIEGSLSYNSVDIEEGIVTNANPTWTGALANQTITYGIARKGGASLPASITIDSSTGTVSLVASAVVADSGTYTITVTGTGNYQGNTTADIAINITKSIQGTLTYNDLDVVTGTASTSNPTWTGALASQTVAYTILRQDGANPSANINIDSSTGTVSVATDVRFQDQGTYTVTATGTGNYTGSTSADIVITITIFIINTADELQAITNNIVTLNSISYNADGTNNTGATGKHIAGNYQLAGNIDLSGMTDFTPIGSKTIPFIGVFDGKGYEVTLNINTAKSYVGLFGYVGINEAYTDNTTAVSNRNNAIEIKNIGVSGTITNTGGYVGGLAGAQHGGSIIGYSKATVASTGGTTARNIGGLLGYQNGGSIIGYATGAISGDSAVGGLVGAQSRSDNQSIVGYATGAVSSPSPGYVGGLLGNRAEQGILTGYSTGSSTGSPFLGGNLYPAQGTYFDASNNGNKSDHLATRISAAANIYKFAGPTETSGRTIGKFYDKATGTSATTEDSGDTEIFTESEFINAFDLANTPNGRFPKLKTSLFGTLPQP